MESRIEASELADYVMSPLTQKACQFLCKARQDVLCISAATYSQLYMQLP